jgi:hypothetical protein
MAIDSMQAYAEVGVDRRLVNIGISGPQEWTNAWPRSRNW